MTLGRNSWDIGVDVTSFSVEMSVEENGFVQTNKGYIRDSKMEYADILKWTKSQLITISEQVLIEEQGRGFDKNPVILVDGKKGKSISEVHPLGSIEFVSRQDFGEILLNAYNEIVLSSKVLTGRYQASHQVVWNKTTVATDLLSLLSWIKTEPQIKVSDTLMIINTQPYARKLELRGVTAGRTSMNKKERTFKRKGVTKKIVVNKPNGTYQLALRRVKSKFKNNVGVFFKFLPGSFLGLSGSFKNGKDQKSIGRPYLYPALIFKIGAEGLF